MFCCLSYHVWKMQNCVLYDKSTEEGNFMDAMDKKDTEVQSEEVLEKDDTVECDAAPEVILQYRGYEVDMEVVTERVKAHYYSKGYKKGSINNLQIYMKPEEFTAYYVINDGVVGKVNLFYD